MLQQENTGMILVDVQGKLAEIVHESKTIKENIARLIQICQIMQLPVIWLEQYPKGLGKTVPELSDLLKDYSSPVEKISFSACGEENFNRQLTQSGRKQWLICGIETHICVYQTALDLKAQNYEPEIVVDCVSSRNPDDISFAVNKLQSKGIAATNLEMCTYELLKTSKRPEFKAILPLIK
ncbi:MAG: hydrolase [Bacteroidia bacterium]|nr:MAG: hydrolase [Bacteroidia bacterium]